MPKGRLFSLLVLLLAISVFPILSQDKKLFDNSLMCDDGITVTASGDLDFGNILKGTTKYYSYDNVIKFKIKSTHKEKINIYKQSEMEKSDGLELIGEWRMGANTGFENNFSSQVVHLNNCNDRTYYVTLKIGSIYAPSSANSGKHTFYQKVWVEVYD